MKCSACGQREAKVEALCNINNRTEKLYLCEVCAAELRSDIKSLNQIMLEQMFAASPMDMIANLGGFFDTQSERVVVCPDCKTRSDDFLKSGYVGCPRCYDVFEPLVRRTVKKLQQSHIHVGKTPYGDGLSDDEAALRVQLDSALDRKDYTLASKITERLQQMQELSEEGDD